MDQLPFAPRDEGTQAPAQGSAPAPSPSIAALGPPPGESGPGNYIASLGAPPPSGGVSDRIADFFLNQAESFNAGNTPDPVMAKINPVLDAFGSGFKTGFGSEPLGVSDKLKEGLQKGGILPDYEKGQGGIIRAFNAAVLPPAAAVLDGLWRVGAGAVGGFQGAVRQVGEETGQQALAREVAGLPEAFPSGFHDLAPPPLPPMEVMRDLGVTDPGQAKYMGTEKPVEPPAESPEPVPQPRTPVMPSDFTVRARESLSATALEVTEPKDVHEAARQIAPDTFNEYDALQEHQNDLRQKIADAQDELRKNAESKAPNAQAIADLQAKLEDATPRLAKKYQARLDALTPEHDAFLADADNMAMLTQDTPEIQAMRQQLLETDFRMRDLAPDVSAAYAKASERFPAPAEPEATVPPPAEVAPKEEPVTEAAKPAEVKPEGANAVPEATEPIKPVAPVAEAPKELTPALRDDQGNPVSIADHRAASLIKAGRPADEAAAAGKVDQALWETRAARFEGRKGTAEEMYAREAPEVRAGKQAKVPEMAQGTRGKIRLATDGRAVITLMRDSNASTFIHETGHDWLERLIRDAADPAAPDDLRKDAATVRQYLGTEEGKPIPTRAHEKFARSFERYMMEGRAPSKALAGVFNQFRNWLTKIYQTVSALRAPITNDIRDVFDRLLAKEPERQPVTVEERANELNLPEPPLRAAPEPLNARVPKEPMRLTAFLRKLGGVIDYGGDVLHMIGEHKNRPGLINATGLPLDKATEMAWHAGYLPGDERPDINTLLEALDNDVNDRAPVYSEQDRDKVEAYHNALDYNSEIEKLAFDHGIDTKGMNRAQFFDALAEKLSFEEMSETMRSIEEAHEDAFGDFAAEAREWMEEHSGAWDSDKFYGIDGPRTQAELEREYDESKDASRPVEQSANSGQKPGVTTGDQNEGQGGNGPGGHGAGDAGRNGEPVAGATGPANRAAPGSDFDANAPFASESSDLIDKAGNIRLDNLNQPEDINNVIRQAAAQNNDFIEARRGVISDQAALDLADALGMQPEDLNRRKIGEAFNAEQVIAARKLLVQSATDVRNKGAAVEAGGAAELAAYVEARERHRMIQEQVSGITAEAGRALRAFRALGGEGEDEARILNQLIKKQTNLTPEQIKAEARLVSKLDTPAAASKLLADSTKPTYGDMLMEYWINGLISGPATHTTYAVGNAALAVSKAVPETAVAAAVGSVRSAFGYQGERVYWGEVAAGTYALFKGQRDGFRAAWAAAKSGMTEPLPGERRADAQGSFWALQPSGGAIPNPKIAGVTVPLGTIARLPSRGVASIHSYFRTIGYETALAQMAYRAAAKEGLTGHAFNARIADLTQNPDPKMMEAARDQATQQTLMGNGSEFVQKLSELTNTPILGFRVLKVIDPFVKISGNVMDQALLERSPLGVIDPEIRANLMGKNGGVARDTQIARIVVGSALATTAIGLASQGLMTGSGPSDPREAAIWRLSGNQPYSVRIGDTWYGYHRLGPLAMVMGIAADMHDFSEHIGTDSIGKLAALLTTSLSKSLLDESFMRGPSDLIKAIDNPDQYGARYINTQLATLVPFSTAEKQIAKAADPYARDARTLMDTIKAGTPGLSQSLYPRYDIFGRPIPHMEDLGMDGLDAITKTRVVDDPVVNAMQAASFFPPNVDRSILGVRLSEAEYADRAQKSGVLFHNMLSNLVNSPAFSVLEPGQQRLAMQQALDRSRRAVDQYMKMQYPNIIKQATINKQYFLQTGKKTGAPEVAE